jgi:metal-responsive CopG/Arc/MetJ family transcriptional regulator
MAQTESPNSTDRVTVRVPGNLPEEYHTVCAGRGSSRSAAIREYMERTVADADLTDRQMPEEDAIRGVTQDVCIRVAQTSVSTSIPVSDETRALL